MKNTFSVGPKNETIRGIKLLWNQRTQWSDYIEEVMNITNVNPNQNSGSSAPLNQSILPFRICGISLPQDQTGSVYFLMSKKYTSHVHIGSTLCLRAIQRKYIESGYASGTDIVLYLSPFVLIAYIFSFRKDRQMIEYTKYQLVDQKHHEIFQWARNAQNIIRYDIELKLINLIRE